MLSNLGEGLLRGGQTMLQPIPEMDFSSPQSGFLNPEKMYAVDPTKLQEPWSQVSAQPTERGLLAQQSQSAEQQTSPDNTNITMNPKSSDIGGMKMSPMGLKTLTISEGVKFKPYRDSQKHWTIGVGHLMTKDDPHRAYSPDEVNNLLQQDLGRFEKTVNESVKVPLKQNEFDSLVHFAYNVGEGAFKKSSLLKTLNAGDRIGAAAKFMDWVKQPELRGRRLLEQKIFLGQ